MTAPAPRRMPALSPTERRTLAMLAEGHTAKSIAAATGVSIHTVNERLREARRKTGAGSSRELARWLRAQENRDEQIGLPAVGDALQHQPRPDAVAPADRWQGRDFIMIIIAAAAGAALLFAASHRANDPGARASAPLPVAATPEGEGSPRVVATSPAAGARIAPGRFTLSVTFDRPMHPDSYSFVQIDPASYPDCPGRPRQSQDGRTYRLDCVASAGRDYVVRFNDARYRNFRGRDGTPAGPAELRFSAR